MQLQAPALRRHLRRATASLHDCHRQARASKQGMTRLPQRPSGKRRTRLPSSPLVGLAAAPHFGQLLQGAPPTPEAAAEQAAKDILPVAVADPCPKRLARETWDVLLAALSLLLVVTCCPLGLLVAALLSLCSLVLDALCQVVVTCQLDPLYTLFGPLTLGLIRWARSGAVRHAVGAVHGAAKRCRRLARATLWLLQSRGLQSWPLRPRMQ